MDSLLPRFFVGPAHLSLHVVPGETPSPHTRRLCGLGPRLMTWILTVSPTTPSMRSGAMWKPALNSWSSTSHEMTVPDLVQAGTSGVWAWAGAAARRTSAATRVPRARRMISTRGGRGAGRRDGDVEGELGELVGALQEDPHAPGADGGEVAVLPAEGVGVDLVQGDDGVGLLLPGAGDLDGDLGRVGDALGRERVEEDGDLLDAHLGRVGADLEDDVRRLREVGELEVRGRAQGGLLRPDLGGRGGREDARGGEDADHGEGLHLDHAAEEARARAAAGEARPHDLLVVRADEDEDAQERDLEEHEAPVGLEPQVGERGDVAEARPRARGQEDAHAGEGPRRDAQHDAAGLLRSAAPEGVQEADDAA